MIFELAVPTPAGSIEVCGGGRYDGLARVLGSNRDDRGVGFASDWNASPKSRTAAVSRRPARPLIEAPALKQGSLGR